MTTPFPFVAGQVLTAAQLNSISELPTRTLTATGNAVAADRYSRIILNGSSISYTVNSATFDVGEVVHLYNINSTAATIAAGTGGVTINAAAGLTLAQYQAATLYAVSSTSFVLWKSDVTATPGALTLISTTTIGSAVASVTVSNAFSSTYDNYKITVNGGSNSAANYLLLQLGSTTANYYSGGQYTSWGGTIAQVSQSNVSSWRIGDANSNSLIANVELFNPNLARRTQYSSMIATVDNTGNGGSFYWAGFQDSATQFTAFTILPGSGTMTGGTIRVYGYSN